MSLNIHSFIRRPASEHFSRRVWPQTPRDLPQAGGGGGGYVATGPNRCDFDRFFRVTTCQQPRRLLHVSSRRRRRPASEHVLPAASGQTTLHSARLAGLVRVCTHAFFSPHLPILLPIVCDWPAAKRHFSRLRWARRARTCMHTCFFFHLICLASFPVCDGQHRPVRRWPRFGRKRPSASWGGGGGGGVTLRRVQISRFQIDATLTDSFALRRANSRGVSGTSPVVVVVGRRASTWCQRPAAKRHFSRRVWPQTPRGSLAPLGSYVICLACFLSSAGFAARRAERSVVCRWPLAARVNFGPNFIKMIKTCYNNIQSAVKVNGFVSSFFFYLSRGIRQGCPISTELYILVAETLAEAVRAD